jgi:hypothetical protein
MRCLADFTAQNVVTAMVNVPGFSCYPNSTTPNDGLPHLD